MKATGKLVETYDNYTRLIQEIHEQNKEFKILIDATSSSYERLAYYDALIKNEEAINKIATDRLN